MALENRLLTRLEPTIKLDEFKFKAYKEEEGQAATSRDKGMDVPLVIINGYRFNPYDIKSMEINLEGSIPRIDLTLTDTRSQFGVDSFPRDGDVISIRMGARAKDTYKDIRIDFDIDNVDTPLKSNADQGNANAKYSFSGKMKVPGLYADRCKSYGVGTTIDHLENIAADLKLGLATNVDTSDDKMNLFIPYDSIADTIDDLVKHSYIDDNSFQTYCIDPYYYINFVDLNSLLDSEDSFESALAALDVEFNDTLDGEGDVNNKIPTTLMISTHERFQGTNSYITRYSIKNNSGKNVKKNGYKRVMQFFENDSENGLVSFDVEPLTSTKMKDIEAPLKGRQDEDRYKEEVKYKYVGRRDSDPDAPNTHTNREFAAIHNAQNMAELEKLQLEVELSSINHAIHRYQRIPVLIFNETIEQTAADYDVKLAKEKKGFATSPKSDIAHETTASKSALNEFLSGFYVVDKIKYTYKGSDGIVKQQLTLLRREWPGRINNME